MSNEAFSPQLQELIDRAGSLTAQEIGAEEAVRATVLAVGVRDLISADDYETLVTPWQQVLGSI